MEAPGLHLIDFSIEQELGHGSFGMVYKVRSLRNGGTYVIKKINIDYLPQRSQKEVIHEAQILKKIDHQSIVKYYCSFMEGKCLCIVMEYIDGGDLHQLIRLHSEKKQYIPEMDIWKMASELSSALQYLHTKSIIHRDVKTLNILITKDKRIKLADLGASKIVSAPMQITRVGTPLYLAPELVKHKPYDFKVDVWALGCVIYSLASLHPPFQAENLITLGIQIVSKNPEPIPPMYSFGLGEFIEKLLAKQPIDRPNMSTVITMIPKTISKEYFKNNSSIDLFSTEITVERHSPSIIEESGGMVWKAQPRAMKPVQEQVEPVAPLFFDAFETKVRCEERPSTASRNRVIFKLEGRSRPGSASASDKHRNPLYHPRDLHTLRIPTACPKLPQTPHRAARKHITITDLYF